MYFRFVDDVMFSHNGVNEQKSVREAAASGRSLMSAMALLILCKRRRTLTARCQKLGSCPWLSVSRATTLYGDRRFDVCEQSRLHGTVYLQRCDQLMSLFILFTARRCASAVCSAVSVRLSVYLSVTSLYSVKRAKDRITQRTPRVVQGLLIFWCQIILVGSPHGGLGRRMHAPQERVQNWARARPPSTKQLFQIIFTHMMNREMIPGRKKRVRRCPYSLWQLLTVIIGLIHCCHWFMTMTRTRTGCETSPCSWGRTGSISSHCLLHGSLV